MMIHNERIYAKVVAADRENPPDEEDVIRFCRDGMEDYKVPRKNHLCRRNRPDVNRQKDQKTVIDGELELILIIGGNGYIGSRLYQELIQSLSEPVRVYDKQCTSPLLKGAQWMQGDLQGSYFN